MRLAALRRALLLDDGDGEWELVSGFEDRTIECLAAGGGRAFCGTYDGGLLRSADGHHWEAVDGLPEHVTSVAVDPHDGDRVWVGTEPSRVFVSTDGGRSFEKRPGLTDLPSSEAWSFPPRPHTHHVRWLEPDPNAEGRLYAGIEAGTLVRTDDGGRTWRDRPEGARRDNHTLSTHPDAPGRVYAAAGDGYAESEDAGDTWTYPQSGLTHRYVWGLAVDAGDPETVLVSAADGAHDAHSLPAESYVYRRRGDDADAGWQRVADLPDGDGTLRAVLAAGAPGEFAALTNRGLYRSTDGGQSFERIETPWREDFTEQTPRGLVL
jgi:photosystem II stability/assembly factor-like uncharacterized protein